MSGPPVTVIGIHEGAMQVGVALPLQSSGNYPDLPSWVWSRIRPCFLDLEYFLHTKGGNFPYIMPCDLDLRPSLCP